MNFLLRLIVVLILLSVPECKCQVNLKKTTAPVKLPSAPKSVPILLNKNTPSKTPVASQLLSQNKPANKNVPITTLMPKLAQSAPIANKGALNSVPINTDAHSNVASLFSLNISTYVEDTTDEPFTSRKKVRIGYSDDVWQYFKQFGIYNCNYAFCENLEIGRKEFKKVPASAGVSISTCKDKFYFVSKANITVAETWQHCCQYGMIPATFASGEEWECFINAYQKISGKLGKNPSKYFVTAFIDANLDSRYISCHSMKSVPKDLWLPKEPNNLGNEEPVISFTEKACDSKMNIIFSTVCESVAANITSIPQKLSNKMVNATNTHRRYTPEVAQELWKLHIPHCKSAFCNKHQIPANVSKSLNNITKASSKLKNYIVKTIQVTYTTAWIECCKLGMVPINVDSVKEVKELKKSLYPDGVTKDIHFITAQIDENLNGSYISCQSTFYAPIRKIATVIPSEMWAAEHPKKNEACVQLVLGANRVDLVSSACDSKANLICEERLKTYSSQIQQIYNQNNLGYCQSSYCRIGAKNPAPNTKSMKVLVGVNKTYHYSVVTSIKLYELWDFCCANNLVPVSIDSMEEYKWLKNNLNLGSAIYFCFMTGMYDIDLSQTYASCVTGKALDSQIPWKKDAIRFIGPSILLHYKGKANFWLDHCDIDASHFPMCQSTGNITNFNSKLDVSALFEEEKSVNPYIAVPVEFFKLKKLFNCESCACNAVTNTNIKAEKIKAGTLVELSIVDSKQYYLLNTNVSYDMVWVECCAVGLMPAAVENKTTLNNLVSKFASNFSNIFWTSQIDSKLNRNFISCTSGNAVPADVWKTGEPNNEGMREACVAVKLDKMSGGLQDVRCGEMIPVICETNNGSNKMNAVSSKPV